MSGRHVFKLFLFLFRGSVATGLPSSLCRIIVIGVMGVLLSGCDYGRMYDQDVIKTYGWKIPEMDARTVPVQDGFQRLVNADPRSLKNPLQYSSASVKQGAQAYGYYCVQCHGPKADGNGTVGQSFAPLPANLSSQPVQEQSDGELYAKIRLGFKRHPRLFTTVSEEEGWAAINYIRSINGTHVAPSMSKARGASPSREPCSLDGSPRASPRISIKRKSE